MYSQRLFRLSQFAVASLIFSGLFLTLGCRIEKPPSRIEKAEIHKKELADAPLPVLPQPDIDDAQRVVETCGQPVSDSVVPIFSKYYNGPVRRLEYAGRRDVKLDFIPSRPRAELAHGEAPLPHGGYSYTLPAGATWRFQAARMEQQVLITAHGVAFYLPCAGDALSRDF